VTNRHAQGRWVIPSHFMSHIALKLIRSGICGLPQSRPIENDQSVVTMSAFAPAALARSMRWAICSRVPIQYSW